MEKQHIITIQLAGISGVLFTILLSLLAFRFFVLPQSQANLSTVEVASGIQPPYVRLETQPFSPEDTEIKIDVLINTGGQPIVGADIDLEYNPVVLGYQESSVELSSYFSTIQEEPWQEGRVRFSVFNSIDLGDQPVSTNSDQELRVATVAFQVKNRETNLARVQVLFGPNRMDETNLVLYLRDRPEFPEDILKNAEGVIISLR